MCDMLGSKEVFYRLCFLHLILFIIRALLAVHQEHLKKNTSL